ncbi:zinc finger protein Rlf isoform X8 [Chrysemys picta bellii]|uniref:zinc finger protein Rlf isoform X8 n=1 Tax=Chrysemys picta bellii TaxID=8478 RepID=UPI0032B24C27
MNAYSSPMPESGSEQLSSSEEETDPQGVFSPYQDSRPQAIEVIRKLPHPTLRILPPGGVNPWMAPPMPYPPPWQYWTPWASYPREYVRYGHSTRRNTDPAPPPDEYASDTRHLATQSHFQDKPSPAPIPAEPELTPEEALLPLPPTPSDDYAKFQDLFKRVASDLRINLEVVTEQQHELTNILQPPSSSRVALPINAALLEPAKSIWQTPATSLPTCKQADRKYFISPKGSEFLFTHPAPNSLVVDATNQRAKQQYSHSAPPNKDSKRLDLFGRKVYASSTLQFRIANYTAVLAKYDHKNYNKFMDFIDDIPEQRKQQLRAMVSEGQSISRTALQAALDVANTAARSTATAVVMRRGSWLSSSFFPRSSEHH